MTIVPRRGDLLDDLLNLVQRQSVSEKGCTGGGVTDPLDDGDTAPTDDAPALETVTRDLIINLEGALRESGKPVFPGGTFPKVTPAAHMIGEKVDPDTYHATTVHFDGKLRYWRKSDASRGSGTAPGGAGSRVFALPPGWWPPSDVVRSVPSGKAGVTCELTVESATGLVRYTDGPDYPTGIDLAAFGSFDGGGGTCPGFDADDPTSAGDGRQWDSCETPGVDGADPIVVPGATGGGAATWVTVPVSAYVTGGVEIIPVGYMIEGDWVSLRGQVKLDASYTTTQGVLTLPSDAQPTSTVIIPGLLADSASALIPCYLEVNLKTHSTRPGRLRIIRRVATTDPGFAGVNTFVDLTGVRFPLSDDLTSVP